MKKVIACFILIAICIVRIIIDSTISDTTVILFAIAFVSFFAGLDDLEHKLKQK